MNIDSIIREEYKRIKERGIHSVPNHYVVNLSDDELKDEFLYVLTSAMANGGLRPFHALDRWLYFSLDGSKNQLNTYRGIIESSAVYDNNFEGVLAFDVSSLLLPVNRAAKETFFNIISSKEISDHSTVIIFMNEMTGVNAQDFLYGLKKCLDYKTVEFNRNKVRIINEK